MTASEPKIIHRIVWTLFVILIVIVAIVSYLLLRPYNDLTIKSTNDTDNMTVISDITKDGMPVIKRGSQIVFEVDYCNRNVDVTSIRWLYQYDKFSVFESENMDEALGATRLPDVKFFPPDDFQPEDYCGISEVAINLPYYIHPGVYSLENVNTYQPNPIRDVRVVYNTERFIIE